MTFSYSSRPILLGIPVVRPTLTQTTALGAAYLAGLTVSMFESGEGIAARWRTRALLTVGESVNDKPDGSPYRMVGIPDGLGAYDNHDGTFTVLMNHELREGAGVPRAHGGIGAFVSQWTIRKHDLKVLHGGDLIKQVYLWDAGAVLADPATFSRFCAADLPGPYAFFHRLVRASEEDKRAQIEAVAGFKRQHTDKPRKR